METSPTKLTSQLTRKNLRKLQKEILLVDSVDNSHIDLSELRVQTLLVNSDLLRLDELPETGESKNKEPLPDPDATEDDIEDDPNSSMVISAAEHTVQAGFEMTETVANIDPSLLRKVEVHAQNQNGGVFKIFDPENSSMLLDGQALIQPQEHTILNESALRPFTESQRNSEDNRASKAHYSPTSLIKKPAKSTKSKIPLPNSFKIPKFTQKTRDQSLKRSFDLKFPKL